MILSTIAKTVPFTLETAERSVELVFSEFSIGDITRLIELQQPLIDESGSGSLNDLYRTRIMCSVKHADTGAYYWDKGISDFNSQNYPSSLIDVLIEQVNELNPIPQIKESLNTKKNDS